MSRIVAQLCPFSQVTNFARQGYIFEFSAYVVKSF